MEMQYKILEYINRYVKNNFKRISYDDFGQDIELGPRGLGLDSVEILSMIYDLETAFHIEFKSEEYYTLDSIYKLAENIQKYIEVDSFLKYCDQFGNRMAVIDGEKRFSYDDIKNVICKTTRQLREIGIRQDDTVLICIENGWEYPVLFFSLLEIGAVPVLADVSASAEWKVMADECGCNYCISECSSVGISGFPGETEVLGKKINVRSINFEKNSVLKEAVLIHYTSGSTGGPKGVVHDIASLRNMFFSFRKDIQFCGEEKMLAALPFSHGYGLSCIFLAGLFSGSCIVVMHRFEPREVVRLLEMENITHFFGVPPMFRLILKVLKTKKLVLPALKYCCSSSLEISYDLIKEFYDYTGKVINQEYGSAEAGVIAYSQFETLPETGNCVGKFLYPDKVKVDESGELFISTPEMALGYSNGQRFDQVFAMNDLVKLVGEDVFLLGRTKNVLECGGKKVFASEVRERLMQTELFEDAYVCNQGDTEKYVCAFIVWKKGKRLDKNELVSRLEVCMDRYKIPSEFRMVSEIMTNQMGKVTQKCIQGMTETSSIL